ncbi:hypothetical protein H1R20_g11821, partial [Candolleomyces eurysporus]
MAIPATEEENAFADEILRQTYCNQTGLLTADAAVEVFNRSGLSRYELRDIWGLADADSNGVLTRDELLVALRVMGWVQSGKSFVESLVDKPGPLPTIQASTSYQAFHVLPADVRKFHDDFVEAGPSRDGYLDGDIVRRIYMKSDLSYSEVSSIWNLVDTAQRERLTFPEFAMGMHLIDALKSCRLSSVPTSLPPVLFEQFENFEPPVPKEQSRSPFMSPKEEANSSSSRSTAPSKSPAVPPRPPPPIKPRSLSKPWTITPTQKTEYDAEFALLDVEGTGLAPEDDALRFLRKYHLPVTELAHIWDLAAIRNDRYLNSDEFAVAMYLVQERLAGKDIPFQLPKFLIPPSLRTFTSPVISPSTPSFQSTSPKGKAAEVAPGINGSEGLKQHRISHSTTSYFSDSPTTELPGPPIPSRLHRSSSSSVSLTFLTENPITYKQLKKRRTSTGASSSSATSTPLIEDDDPLEDLRTETKTLRRQVDNLLEQLSSQNEYRTSNEQLRRENGELKTKIAELETSMASVLTQMQSNDNALSEALTREIERLTGRVTELEQTETQLQQTVGILEVAKRDNGLLTNQIRDLRNAEATYKTDAEAAQNAMDDLEREKEDLKARLSDMMKVMSQPDNASSSRELRVLLQDVTKENQNLKKRVREMEKSMEQMLLSSRDTTRKEELKRENRELKLQIQELEQLTAQLQSTHEDSHLQQVLAMMTRENEGMKVRIRELQAGPAQVRSEYEGKIAEMQRKIDALSGENEHLKAQMRTMSTSRSGGRAHHAEEDMSVPPPAYDDNEFIPADIR